MPAYGDFEGLLLRVEALRDLGCQWSGYVYRLSDIGNAKKEKLLSGEGSRINGGRWNGPGSFRAVYASLTEHTAIDEAKSMTLYYSLEGHTIFPKVISALEVSLQNVLDLTSGSCRSRLRISREEMVGCDWRKEQDKGNEALSQAIGRAIYCSGFEGFLAPSAADKNGVNFVYFPRRLQKTSKVGPTNPKKYKGLK